MRDIFTEIFENQPADPMESARRGAKPQLRKRFYKHAEVGESGAILLDGKPVMTPKRRAFAAPTPSLAEKMVQEWNAQTDVIEPGSMPLTRLANAVIDGVADAPVPVAAEIENYLGSDLLCYRAGRPEGLVERQASVFDPVLMWAADALGARFTLAQGVMHVAQPEQAIAAAAMKIPTDANSVKEIWRLGALSLVTTLTGSGLLALALAHGQIDADTAWSAAHVDEDWQMSQWGRDEMALKRRAFRRTEFDAAAAVLAALR
jgi:chaperone required for assembly of F1-ATPase